MAAQCLWRRIECYSSTTDDYAVGLVRYANLEACVDRASMNRLRSTPDARGSHLTFGNNADAVGPSSSHGNVITTEVLGQRSMGIMCCKVTAASPGMLVILKTTKMASGQGPG